jgi:general secretion pathway protein D
VVRALLLAVLLPLCAAPARAQVQPGPPITLDFQDLDLAYVLMSLATAAGLNVMYHDLPAKPITIRTSQPVPRTEIPALIRSLAAANQVTVIEEPGGFVRFMGAGDAQPDPRQFYFYRLKHARAAVLSQTLQSLFGGGGGGGNAAGGLRPTLGQQLRELQQPAQPAVVQQLPQGIVIGGGPGFTGNVVIVPDEVTNTLLIRATPSDWAIVEQAVQSLDLRPLQVVIEVLIAEVRHTDALDVGTSFTAVRETSGGFGVVTVPPAPSTPADAVTVNVARFGSVDIDATLAALAVDGNVRILSRPVVLAQNNQEARILVGSQQPFVQFSQVDVTGTPFQTVQYREVGTVLTILPTINEDGYVNLSVAQEVSSATAETQFGAPIISTREAETQLLARNGQTVVLGGLIDEQVDKVNSGIPFLKDIPLLGLLFGTRRERVGNSELFLFLTPYIVATDEDADAFRQRIENEREMLSPLLPAQPLTPSVVIPDTVVPPPPPPPDTLSRGRR